MPGGQPRGPGRRRRNECGELLRLPFSGRPLGCLVDRPAAAAGGECTACCTRWACSIRSGRVPHWQSALRAGPRPAANFRLYPPRSTKARPCWSRRFGGQLRPDGWYQNDFPEAEVTVVICNDGVVAGYPEWQETERLAERLRGRLCITRGRSGAARKPVISSSPGRRSGQSGMF